MADTTEDEKFLAAAQTNMEAGLKLLAALNSSDGCELLMRRGRPVRDPYGGWRRLPMSDDFSMSFRKAISKSVLESGELDLTVLAYGATKKGERVGVAQKSELDSFFKQLPERKQAPEFDPTSGVFAAQDRKCVHVALPQSQTLSAFGPSGASEIGKYARSKFLAVWNSKKEVDYPKGELLEIGDRVSFFSYGEFVYVLDEEGFASATGYYDIVKERSKVALGEFDALSFVDFSDRQAIEDLIESSPDFARRLSASSARGFINNLNKEGLERVLKGFAKQLSWKDVDGVIVLNTKFKNKDEKRAFKQLLGQVFVYCAATGAPLLSYSSEPARG